MKRKILVVLLIFSMFLGGYMNVGALTTGSYDTANVIDGTEVSMYGRHYAMKDYKGVIIHSYNSGNNGTEPTGIFRYFDSAGASIFCGQLGSKYVADTTHIGEPVQHIGAGAACGILLSLNAGKDSASNDNIVKEGESDGTSIIGQEKDTKLGIQLSYFDSNSTDYYNKNNASYVSIQKAIWKYQSNPNTTSCVDASGKVVTDYKVTGQDFANTTLTLPQTVTMKLSADGKYYEATINATLQNENSLNGDITYTVTSPAIIEKVNNKKVNVKIEVSKYVKGMNLQVKATGKHKDYTYISYKPVVAMYNMGRTTDNNGNDIDAQDMATVSLISETKTVEKDFSATTTLTVPSGSIEVLKTNSINSQPVEGAKFNLYIKRDGKYVEAAYLNGAKVGDLTTDASGKILINDLPFGEYKIEETGAALGYIYDEENHLEREIVIDTKTNNYTGENAIKITNDPIKVVISKKDVAKEGELEGAKIVVYKYDETSKEKGEEIVEFVSTKEPYEYYLEPGVYALEETLAPDTYEKLETTFVFKVEADGDVKLLETYSDKNIIVENNSITIYNEIVIVPDTNSSMNIIYAIIGGTLLLLGLGLIYFTIKRRKAESI